MESVELDVRCWDRVALAAAWKGSDPFPHVVVDEAVAGSELESLRAAVAREPHYAERSEIIDGFGSTPVLQQPVLAGFAASLGCPAVLGAVKAVTGKDVRRAELRSYVYPRGGYLLPH